jgi:hypothetical protein
MNLWVRNGKNRALSLVLVMGRASGRSPTWLFGELQTRCSRKPGPELLFFRQLQRRS